MALVKANTQAYTGTDIFPNLCVNAQPEYKKARYKVVVLPDHTTIKVEQPQEPGDPPQVELTPVDQADLAAMNNGDEFWVEGIFRGEYIILVSHNQVGTYVQAASGMAFAFRFHLERDIEGDYGAIYPSGLPQGGTVAASHSENTAKAINYGGSTQTNAGARAGSGYNVSVVSDYAGATGLTVKARTRLRLRSEGTVTIRNYPTLPAFSIGLSHSWGLVSLSVAESAFEWPKLGNSAGGAGVQLWFNGNTSPIVSDSRSNKDVIHTDSIIAEETFEINHSLDYTDEFRLYTVGSKYPAKGRADVLSSVKPGTFGVDTCVPNNTHSSYISLQEEQDGLYEIQ